MQKNEQLIKRNDFIEQNLGLVRLCAKRFYGKGIDYEELYAAGCIGLIKAADGFDSSLGYRFSSYAVPAILGEIRKLFRESGTIRIGRKIKDLSYRISIFREGYLKQYGEEPAISVLAERLESTAEEITQAILAGMPVSSLTYAEDDEGETEQLDIPTESFDEILPEKITLEQAIDRLKDEDRKLIQLRYLEDKTQAETAKILGTSQVQISRKEKKILLQLRQQLEV